MFNFFCFTPEKPFLGKSSPKNQNCQFRPKVGDKTNPNMQNLMMMFTFSDFDYKYPSWANLVHIFKIVCSKWNLIQRLIWICKIQWWCLFYVLDWKQLPFLDKLGPKNQNCQFKLKIGTKTNSNMKKSMVIFTFSLFNRTCSFFFFWNLFQKLKLFVEAEI